MHLLVVMIFENTEVRDFGEQEAKDIQEVYFQTIARNLTHEKRMMVQELTRAGIQTILSDPADLSLNTVNKY